MYYCIQKLCHDFTLVDINAWLIEAIVKTSKRQGISTNPALLGTIWGNRKPLVYPLDSKKHLIY